MIFLVEDGDSFGTNGTGRAREGRLSGDDVVGLTEAARRMSVVYCTTQDGASRKIDIHTSSRK